MKSLQYLKWYRVYLQARKLARMTRRWQLLVDNKITEDELGFNLTELYHTQEKLWAMVGYPDRGGLNRVTR